jgi:lysophospholipase L1-like esterase
MRRYEILAWICCSMMSAVFVFAEEYSLRPAVECTVRGGLPHVFAQFREGADVNIAYLGGSITCQNGYRPKSMTWFREQYPDAALHESNAGIGGTNSTLGVFRLDNDVLRHEPDLLFIEFAVNDGGTDPAQIIKAMEGIVRKTWKANPNTDICFVYTLANNMIEDLQRGVYPRAASAMEAVADHYAIPSIHMGLQVALMEKEGTLLFKGEKPSEPGAGPIVFSRDGVHPYEDTGHQLYVEAIIRSMQKIKTVSSAKPHRLITPLHPENFEQARIYPVTPNMLSGQWEDLTEVWADKRWNAGFRQPLPKIWKSTTPGATLTFSFTGTYAAIYDVIGPDCGQVVLQLDAAEKRTAPRIDSYCTYSRLSTLEIGNNLDNKTHRVEIVLDEQLPDKKAILATRNNAIDNEKVYNEKAWYPGALLILGTLEE